ncbi:hypothetical protein [Nostoc sp. NOS(2021)]|nr:hypothetical protein [Nostoc sp. NOS(2021)]
MSTKRPARKGNPDLRQQKHLPVPRTLANRERDIFIAISRKL